MKKLFWSGNTTTKWLICGCVWKRCGWILVHCFTWAFQFATLSCVTDAFITVHLIAPSIRSNLLWFIIPPVTIFLNLQLPLTDIWLFPFDLQALVICSKEAFSQFTDVLQHLSKHSMCVSLCVLPVQMTKAGIEHFWFGCGAHCHRLSRPSMPEQLTTIFFDPSNSSGTSQYSLGISLNVPQPRLLHKTLASSSSLGERSI